VISVVWTQHSLQMLLERGIVIDWVTDTISNPQHVEIDPARPDRVRAYRQIEAREDRWLRVVYEKSRTEITVITVFFDRNAGRWT
jgi:Domain of unknown function (DUF4258)